jgi:ADP-ribose pyrophosphatase
MSDGRVLLVIGMLGGDMAPDIRTTATRVVYENRWMRVREDAIVRQDGSPGIYGVVEKADFAIIAPVERA